MSALANAATGYVWEDPGDSIMIQVSLELIERLRAAIEQALGTGQRGLEAGGILLGQTISGYGRAVRVDDFELAPCEHLRGASYTLSPKDKRTLGSHLQRHGAQQVVGYFRSHTRPGMYLDQDDFAVFSQYFPEPWQVFLLVKPSTDGTATGGFFFWEDGDLNRRAPYRTFPFSAGLIAQEGYPVTSDRPAVAKPAVLPVADVRATPMLIPKPLVPPVSTGPGVRAPQAKITGPAWGRRLPSLPWVVVPVIAVLFLIAGLFVSENPAPPAPTAAAKSQPPVERLLPEPVPDVVPPATVASNTGPGVGLATPEPAKPSPMADRMKLPPPTKAVATAAAGPQKPAPAPARALELPLAPPALALKMEPRLPDVLPVRVHAAPPPEAEVTYDAPRPGVFRRALRKIEGPDENGAFVPASPIHRVVPMKPSNAEARVVDVKVSIDDTGAVSKAQLVGKSGDLGASALNAARQWQFKPARKHDRPVSSEIVLHFRY